MSSLPLSQTLIGTWRLVSRQDRTASGELRIDPSLGADPIALLVYDRRGNFAAQFMKRDRQGPVPEPAGVTAPNNSRATGGYDAYFGSYTVDDAEGTVTQRLDGALSPENVGLVVTRSMRAEGDALIIQLATASADGTPVVRTLRWNRAA